MRRFLLLIVSKKYKGVKVIGIKWYFDFSGFDRMITAWIPPKGVHWLTLM